MLDADLVKVTQNSPTSSSTMSCLREDNSTLHNLFKIVVRCVNSLPMLHFDMWRVWSMIFLPAFSTIDNHYDECSCCVSYVCVYVFKCISVRFAYCSVNLNVKNYPGMCKITLHMV